MTPSRDAIETSYAFCRQMSRRAGSSFHAGFLLLPREKRRAMEALYAFMRHTDDLADDAVARPLRLAAALTASGGRRWSDAMLGDASGERVETQADADSAEQCDSVSPSIDPPSAASARPGRHRPPLPHSRTNISRR